MPGVQTFPRQVTALDAARRRHKDMSRRRRRLAPVDRAKSVWRARLGAVVRRELGDGDVAVAVPTGGRLRRALVGGTQGGGDTAPDCVNLFQRNYLGV